MQGDKSLQEKAEALNSKAKTLENRVKIKQRNLGVIRAMLTAFINNYNFNRAFLSIRGRISINPGESTLRITCGDYFDNWTNYECATLENKLVLQIKEYLERQNISDPIILRDGQRDGWSMTTVEIVIEVVSKV